MFNKFNTLYSNIILEYTCKIDREYVRREFCNPVTMIWRRELSKYGVNEKLYIEFSCKNNAPVGSVAISNGRTFNLRKDTQNQYYINLMKEPSDDFHRTPEKTMGLKGIQIIAETEAELLNQCIDFFFNVFPQYKTI
jgi:hypothetical protein